MRRKVLRVQAVQLLGRETFVYKLSCGHETRGDLRRKVHGENVHPKVIHCRQCGI